MPNFGCRCGHIISLVAAPSPHEASLISDAHFEKFCTRRTVVINAFLSAVRNEVRDEWIAEFYGCAPFEISNGEIIDDIICREDVFSIRVTTCPECGRLYRQRQQNTNEWECFVPESTQSG